ncbi:MAG TPA: hypothetical protein VF146_20155 [Bryobacteraceae bacterium]
MDYAKAIPVLLPLVLINLASGLRADQIQINPQAQVQFGIPTTGQIVPVVNYMVGANPWQTTTDPLVFDSASTLQSQGLSNPFLQELSSGLGAGWSFDFNTGVSLADNTFQIGTYDAQGPAPPTNNRDALANANLCTANNCVGTEFAMNYVPTGSDPTSNVHWVQILLVNFLTNGAATLPFYLIDNDGGSVPYYDSVFAAGPTGFLDLPFIITPGAMRDFEALTLLVTGPPKDTPGQFTIYGGVQWGWSNQRADPVATPEPIHGALFVTLFLIAIQVLRVWRRSA